LSVSAAKNAEGSIILSLVNTDPNHSHPVVLPDMSGTITSARVLSGDAMDAHNTFEHKARVTPQTLAVTMNGDGLNTDLPPHSVAVIIVE